MKKTLKLAAKKKTRLFVNKKLVIKSWQDIEPYFKTLDKAKLKNLAAIEEWLLMLSELEAVLQEDVAWRYIKHTCDTANDKLSEKLHFFYLEIEPKAQQYFDRFNRKLLSSPAIGQLDADAYQVYLRRIKKATELFRKENLSIQAEIQTLANSYGMISGQMTVSHQDQELTFNQAAKYLKEQDRTLRKTIYDKIINRRAEDKDQFNHLFDELLKSRHQVAINAGFENYRDYMFAELGRFDYTPQDCKNFHQAIITHVVPAVEAFEQERKNKLGYETLKPYDLDVDPEGKAPLKIFETGKELVDLTVKCFQEIEPAFADIIRTMEKKGHLDLESRKGKAPGGYNYPLYISSYPFIFMNAAGDLRDVVTMAHEGGHAIHAVLADELKLSAFKHTPSEIAEVASMAMELIAMEQWHTIFNNEEELKRAKHFQLEKIISVLPWIACVDAFQMWVYENPKHTHTEREEKWMELLALTSGKVIDKSEYEALNRCSWHKQLHIFEVPFYYIEYAIAQLGAIGIWKNYRENPTLALQKYIDALSLGYTKTLPELYETAGITFDFSSQHVQNLVAFVLAEKSKI